MMDRVPTGDKMKKSVVSGSLILFFLASISFAAPQVTLTVNMSGAAHGTASVLVKKPDGSIVMNCSTPLPQSCSGQVTTSTSVELSVTVALLDVFSGWADPTGSAATASSCTGTTSPCKINMGSDGTIKAVFAQKPTFRLSVQSAGPNASGSLGIRSSSGLNLTNLAVTPGSAAALILKGDTTIVTAVPSRGFRFKFWTAGPEGIGAASQCLTLSNNSDSTCKFIMSQAANPVANFEAVSQ
jgi:hypothetical protein